MCGMPGVFQPESRNAQLLVLGTANTCAFTVPPFAGTVQLSGVAQFPASFICTSTAVGLYHWKATLGPSTLPAGVIFPFVTLTCIDITILLLIFMKPLFRLHQGLTARVFV